jgi:hypothetical protein
MKTFPGQDWITSAISALPPNPSGNIALSTPPMRVALPPATMIESGIDALPVLIVIKHDMSSVDCDYVSGD